MLLVKTASAVVVAQQRAHLRLFDSSLAQGVGRVLGPAEVGWLGGHVEEGREFFGVVGGGVDFGGVLAAFGVVRFHPFGRLDFGSVHFYRHSCGGYYA